MTETIPDPQIYRAAADVIRTNGWHQGYFFDARVALPPSKCPVCLLGALSVAAGDEPDEYGQAVHQAELWLTRNLLKELDGVTVPESWNDDPNRTEADVLALLDRAASAAESARDSRYVAAQYAEAGGYAVDPYDEAESARAASQTGEVGRG